MLNVYRVTESFVKDKVLGVTFWVRRALVSKTGSVAEGFGKQSAWEEVRCGATSLGLVICGDVRYIAVAEFDKLGEQAVKKGTRLLMV